jgi:hypothetical protein
MRFLLGLLLVVASAIGDWVVVHAARTTQPVLAAAHPIVPGQVVTAADLVEIEARLGDAGEGYLEPASLVDGMVATRVIAAGELVPSSAMGSAADVDLTTLVVRSALDVPAGIVAGSAVELWATPLTGPGQYGEPVVIVTHAVIAEVRADDSMVSRSGADLEVVVSRDEVAVVLEHVAGGSAMSAVPASVPRAAVATPAPEADAPSPEPAEEAS